MHAPPPIHIVLRANLITQLHAFPAGQPDRPIRALSPAAAADKAFEGGVARRAGGGDAELDTGAGVVLGAGVGREDLDGVVDAGNGEEGFVRMA